VVAAHTAADDAKDDTSEDNSKNDDNLGGVEVTSFFFVFLGQGVASDTSPCVVTNVTVLDTLRACQTWGCT
jgi:hypothetical protein